jgi:hypothetical protein
LRIAAFSSSDWAETVLRWRQNTTQGGDGMHTVTVRLPADGFSAGMATMREWLDRNSYEPTRFKYDQDEDAVVVSIDFPTDAAAQAFASRFVAEHEPPGPAPAAGDSSRQPAK